MVSGATGSTGGTGYTVIGMHDEDLCWFLEGIGRLPTTFELALLNLGANPLSRAESARLGGITPVQLPKYHSEFHVGERAVCGTCGHWQEGHTREGAQRTANVGGCRCYEHCLTFWCGDVGYLMPDGSTPECSCADLEGTRAVLGRVARFKDVRRTGARQALQRLRDLARGADQAGATVAAAPVPEGSASAGAEG